MADYQIDCVNKPDRNSPHEAITHVGGPNPNGYGRWKNTAVDVVRMIENNSHRFYTRDAGKTALVSVRTNAAGRKYLQTRADGLWSNNLLAQSECG